MKLYLRKSAGVILFIGSFWLPFYLGHKLIHIGDWYTVPLIMTLFGLYFAMAWLGVELFLDRD